MSQSSLAELVFNGAWLIRDANGEYLDVVLDSEHGTTHLASVPISRVRYAFRPHRVQDVGTRQWGVMLEPVPLEPRVTSGETAVREAAPVSIKLPMQLGHYGCLNFGLTQPSAQVRSKMVMASAAVSEGLPAVETYFEQLPEDERQLSLDVDLLTLAFTASTVNFPVFEGEAGRAFDSIAAQLGFDPHSDRLDEAALNRLERPADISAAAWREVNVQLLLEIHYRYLCRLHLDAMTRFIQNVFIANTSLVETVGSLIKLESGKVMHLMISGMFSAIASGVGALPFAGAGVVGGGLNVVFQIVLRDRGPNAAELAVALAKARDSLAELFNDLITGTEKLKASVFKDWGKLEEMGKALERDDGAYQWPEDDSKMREEARRQLEISLWKGLLKVKWHHMTASDDPAFYSKYNDANKAAYEKANPHYWVSYRSGVQKDLFGKKTKGFYVSYHWLGYGGHWMWHHEPAKAMCDRLFNFLKVPRQDVFTDSTWGLVHEKFYVEKPVPII